MKNDVIRECVLPSMVFEKQKHAGWPARQAKGFKKKGLDVTIMNFPRTTSKSLMTTLIPWLGAAIGYIHRSFFAMRNYCHSRKGPCHIPPCLANLLTLWRKSHASAGDVTTWSTPMPESVSRIFTVHLLLYNSAAN